MVKAEPRGKAKGQPTRLHGKKLLFFSTYISLMHILRHRTMQTQTGKHHVVLVSSGFRIQDSGFVAQDSGLAQDWTYDNTDIKSTH